MLQLAYFFAENRGILPPDEPQIRWLVPSVVREVTVPGCSLFTSGISPGAVSPGEGLEVPLSSGISIIAAFPHSVLYSRSYFEVSITTWHFSSLNFRYLEHLREDFSITISSCISSLNHNFNHLFNSVNYFFQAILLRSPYVNEIISFSHYFSCSSASQTATPDLDCLES